MSSIFIRSIDHPYGGNFRNKFCSRVMTYFKLMKYSFFVIWCTKILNVTSTIY